MPLWPACDRPQREIHGAVGETRSMAGIMTLGRAVSGIRTYRNSHLLAASRPLLDDDTQSKGIRGLSLDPGP